MGRLAIYGLISTGLSAFVVLSAWLQRRQFYPTCLHLTRSSASLMVLLNMGLFLTIMFGRGMQRLFFGNLRALEVEHLYERSWFAVTETCLAMTIFRDEFDIRFIIFFAILLLVKIFHWIAQDRVDFMEQSPNLSVSFHVKMVGIMSILYAADLGLLYYTVDYTIRRGASMMIIFGFEYTILISLILSISAKYALHSIDMRRETPWENKSMYIFYLELVIAILITKHTPDFFKLITYFLFFAIVVHFYGLPLHIIRDLYMTLRSFIHRCRDLIQYRRATANMNERYPDATAEELAATDRVCIICREEMEIRGPAPGNPPVEGAAGAVRPGVPGQPNQQAPAGGDPSTPKKLGRRSVLADAAPGAVPLPPGVAVPQPLRPNNAPIPPANQAQPPAAPAAGAQPVAFPLQQALQALWNQQQQQPAVAPGIASGGGTAGTPGTAATGGAGDVTSVFLMPPGGGDAKTMPLPASVSSQAANINMYPFTLTPLASFGNAAYTPQALDHLTDDQLSGLEGRTREAVVNRIRAVQNVQSQLTGVVTQLTQILQMFPEGEAIVSTTAAGSVASSSKEAKGKEPVSG
ncbi:hypothetical protein HDU67_005241 [Dinochytrium kinnereticum]|nr:hypothetical protein HDU67_005241 [Dinochytrium kinnereticum]